MELTETQKISDKEVLAWLETSTAAEINDVVQGAIRRYSILFPDWKMIVCGLEISEKKERRKQIKALKKILDQYR